MSNAPEAASVRSRLHHKDRPDYTVFTGEWRSGALSIERRGFKRNSHSTLMKLTVISLAVLNSDEAPVP
jgi:hypothetical protein